MTSGQAVLIHSEDCNTMSMDNIKEKNSAMYEIFFVIIFSVKTTLQRANPNDIKAPNTDISKERLIQLPHMLNANERTGLLPAFSFLE